MEPAIIIFLGLIFGALTIASALRDVARRISEQEEEAEEDWED